MSYKKETTKRAAEMQQRALELRVREEDPDVLTLKEFAAVIRKSYSTAYKIYRRGKIVRPWIDRMRKAALLGDDTLEVPNAS